MHKIQHLCFASLLFISIQSQAGLPESRAFDAAMEAAGQLLSSPALPSLDNERLSLTPLAGTVTMQGQNETATVPGGESFQVTNTGELKGNVAGLALNYAGGGDLGFFVFAGGSQVTGELTTSTTNALTSTSTNIRDISAQTVIATAGLNWRFMGDAKSTLAMGLFVGPAIMDAKSSGRFAHQDGTSTTVTLNPSLSGLYFGLQAMLRLGEFRLNPYMNVMGGQPQCVKPTYTGDPYPVGQYNRCMNGDHGIETFAGLYGVGLNAGYGRFQFGVASQGGGGTEAFKTTPIMLSFRIGL